MTIDTPQMTRPARETKPARWEVGDVLTVDGRRYRIIAISPRGHVKLRQTNNPNAQCYWNTTLDKLPEKTS